jgi:dipeptidyl aminopeptidase/acylaminoacyl peptidase
MPEYADYLPVQRLRPVLSVSADGRTVAYASDASGQFNLWIQPVSGGTARQLTFFTGQSVRQIAWAPDGKRLAFTADTHGDEQTQVYVIGADGGDPVRLSAANDRQYRIGEIGSFDPSGRYVLCGGNDRDQAVPDLILYDLSGGPALRFEGVPGRIVYPVAFAADGHRILAGSWGANTDFQSYIADITRPQAGLVPVTAHLPGSFYYPGPWDGAGFLVRTTTDQEGLARLGRVSVPDGTLTIIDSPPWDVEEQIAVAAAGQAVVWTVNEDGRSVLNGQKNGAGLDLPAIPDGVVHAVQVTGDASAAVLLLDTPGRPMEVAVADLGGDQVRYLTGTRPPAAASVVPELCHYSACDGTPIPAWLYRPPGSGPHPVLLYIHGGPESQARPVYNALFQCLLASGIAVMAPNVRGSTGYGQAWQKRIYRDWGGIDLADFEAAAAYLRAQDWADPDRIAVLGKSYGGFAALSCVSRLPGLWAAAVSAYGPSNLVTLARTVPPDWATIVATMFGDPDENAEDLRERSPVTYADRIAAPLLVIQGAKDPRVPKAESDQIVDRARANGAEVEYLVFEDEGHGFTSRENDIKAHTAIVEFLARHLRLSSVRLPRTGLGNFCEIYQFHAWPYVRFKRPGRAAASRRSSRPRWTACAVLEPARHADLLANTWSAPGSVHVAGVYRFVFHRLWYCSISSTVSSGSPVTAFIVVSHSRRPSRRGVRRTPIDTASGFVWNSWRSWWRSRTQAVNADRVRFVSTEHTPKPSCGPCAVERNVRIFQNALSGPACLAACIPSSMYLPRSVR